MTRLAGENGITRKEEPSYAKCLLVALKPSSHDPGFSITAHRGDSLCVVDKDQANQETILGGRKIVDVKVIEQWISTCSRLHNIDCSPVRTQDLQDIRLVNVLDQKIMGYPDQSCEYLAPSYVWGDMIQPSFQLGSLLGSLPRIIEDLMVFARSLGKQYAWIDSLCVDQDDEADKIPYPQSL